MNKTKPRVETNIVHSSEWKEKIVPIYFVTGTGASPTILKSCMFEVNHKFNEFTPPKITKEFLEIWILRIPEKNVSWI